MIVRVLGSVLLLFVCLSSAARACTCSEAPPGMCPGLQGSDAVFTGTVTEVQDIAYGADKTDASGAAVDRIASRLTRYHFQIEEEFSGTDAAELDIFAGGDDDGDCAYRFRKGQRYVVFAHQESEGRLFATICSGTRLEADARALLPQLRAMRDGTRVASVFGILRSADPPLLAPPDDPEDPLPNISLKLRSKLDRFETASGADGVFSFYDVHAGEYRFTADLPPRTELTQRGRSVSLTPFTIPDGACFEYDVIALPTGHIRGSVLGANGKPLPLASVELYRAGTYADSRPGFWAFQGDKGIFDFDHIGPGDYVLVFNRMNVMDPNAPYARAFYPGAADASDAEPIHIEGGQQLTKVNIQLMDPFPTRQIRVRLKWEGGKLPGDITVTAKADEGRNPAVRKISDGLYQLTVLESAGYTVSGWQDVTPQRSAASRKKKPECPPPSRIDAGPITLSGSDADTKEVTLVFSKPACAQQ